MKKVYLCIQCVYPDQSCKIGSFLRNEDKTPFSPRFDDLVPLFNWIKENYPDARQDGYAGYVIN